MAALVAAARKDLKFGPPHFFFSRSSSIITSGIPPGAPSTVAFRIVLVCSFSQVLIPPATSPDENHREFSFSHFVIPAVPDPLSLLE